MSGAQTDLFSCLADESAKEQSEEHSQMFMPLAARLRPESIDNFIGQSHLLGTGKPLRAALDRGQCYSMVLWGPPGVGKTTLALLFAKATKAHFIEISAVTSGIKDIKAAVDKAQFFKESGEKTILFVDEVHRFNKTQQDAFLPYIENGTVTFIGATTENPSFSLNKALLSRARVYVLKKFSHEECEALIDLALTSKKGLKNEDIRLTAGVKEALIDLCGGDGRYLLNILEMASDLAAPHKDGGRIVTVAMVGAIAGRKLLNYDKGGDAYYELISAFHKSVRGSAPDAALYWYARILEAGGDPLYVARRLLAIATEDVGLCDPKAMQVCLNAYDIYERVGAAEGERAIAEATVYCALAPKSNHLYTAFHAAREDAQKHGDLEVPLYLRNAPTKLMQDLGYKEGYRYAHDYAGAYAAGESFFPEELHGTVYYKPSDRGAEQIYQKKIEYLRACDESAENPRYKKNYIGKKTSYR
jgi:putative ATPase